MEYTGSPDQKIAMQNAMSELKERGFSDLRMVEAILDWQLNRGERTTISPQTYNSYRLYGRFPTYDTGRLIFEFLCYGPLKYRLLNASGIGAPAHSDEERFVDLALKLFSAGDKGFRYDNIQSLCGNYEMYRHLWRRGGEGFLVRSLLRIEKVGKLFALSEHQKFGFRGNHVDEEDRGFVLPYSTNFAAITNSDRCMKFYAFHDFDPEPQTNVSTNELWGNLIALSGPGPHPSYAFYARRTQSLVDLEHIAIAEIRNDETFQDMLDWLEPRRPTT